MYARPKLTYGVEIAILRPQCIEYARVMGDGALYIVEILYHDKLGPITSSWPPLVGVLRTPTWSRTEGIWYLDHDRWDNA